MGGCGKHRGPVSGRLRPRGEFTFCLLGDPQQSHLLSWLVIGDSMAEAPGFSAPGFHG